MDAIQLLLLSILLYIAAGLAALLLHRYGHIARGVAGWLGVLASIAGVASAGLAMVAKVPPELRMFQIEPFGWCVIQIDQLSALLVGLIALVSAGTSMYSLSSDQGQGVTGFFTHIFVASMLLVVTIVNGFFFLLFWELMTLTSYFLVIWEYENEESIRTGYVYMLVAHAGAALIMVAFFILFQNTGSFDFRMWKQAWISPGLKNLAFILVFIGFGAKAGMVPLHFWTPGSIQRSPEPCLCINVGCDEEDRHLWHLEDLCRSTWRSGVVVGIYPARIWCNFRCSGRVLCTGGAGYQEGAGVLQCGKRRHHPDGSRRRDGRTGEGSTSPGGLGFSGGALPCAQPRILQRSSVPGSRLGR